MARLLHICRLTWSFTAELGLTCFVDIGAQRGVRRDKLGMTSNLRVPYGLPSRKAHPEAERGTNPAFGREPSRSPSRTGGSSQCRVGSKRPARPRRDPIRVPGRRQPHRRPDRAHPLQGGLPHGFSSSNQSRSPRSAHPSPLLGRRPAPPPHGRRGGPFDLPPRSRLGAPAGAGSRRRLLETANPLVGDPHPSALVDG